MTIPDESSQSTLFCFFRMTIREIPEKLPSTLIALFIYYWLPLILMGLKDLFLSPVLVVPVLVCAIVFLTQPTPTSRQLLEKSDRNSMIILIAATIISQTAVMTDWGMAGNAVFEWNVCTIGGIILMLAGLAVRVWAIMELGKYFDNSVRIQNNHRIIDTGPYSHVRHGSYSGVYILAVGIALYFTAWWGLIVTIAILGCAYYYRIQQEEKAMLAAFGNSYRDYCKKTYRMFPFIW